MSCTLASRRQKPDMFSCSIRGEQNPLEDWGNRACWKERRPGEAERPPSVVIPVPETNARPPSTRIFASRRVGPCSRKNSRGGEAAHRRIQMVGQGHPALQRLTQSPELDTKVSFSRMSFSAALNKRPQFEFGVSAQHPVDFDSVIVGPGFRRTRIFGPGRPPPPRKKPM